MKKIQLPEGFGINLHHEDALRVLMVPSEYRIKAFRDEGVVLDFYNKAARLHHELDPLPVNEVIEHYRVLPSQDHDQPILVDKDQLHESDVIKINDEELALHLGIEDDFGDEELFIVQLKDKPDTGFVVTREELEKHFVPMEALRPVSDDFLSQFKAPPKPAVHAGASLFGGPLDSQAISPSADPADLAPGDEEDETVEMEGKSDDSNVKREPANTSKVKESAPKPQDKDARREKTEGDKGKDKDHERHSSPPYTQARGYGSGSGYTNHAAEALGRLIATPIIAPFHALKIVSESALKGAIASAQGVSGATSSAINLTREKLQNYRLRQCEQLADGLQFKMDSVNSLVQQVLNHPVIKADVEKIESIKKKGFQASPEEVRDMRYAMGRVRYAFYDHPELMQKKNLLMQAVQDTIASGQRTIQMADRIKNLNPELFINAMESAKKTATRLVETSAKIEKIDNNKLDGLEAVADAMKKGYAKLDALYDKMAEIIQRIMERLFGTTGVSSGPSQSMKA